MNEQTCSRGGGAVLLKLKTRRNLKLRLKVKTLLMRLLHLTRKKLQSLHFSLHFKASRKSFLQNDISFLVFQNFGKFPDFSWFVFVVFCTEKKVLCEQCDFGQCSNCFHCKSNWKKDTQIRTEILLYHYSWLHIANNFDFVLSLSMQFIKEH